MNSFKQMIKAGVIKRTDTGMFIRHADIHVKPGFNRRVEDERFQESIDELTAYMAAGGEVPALEVYARDGDTGVDHEGGEVYKPGAVAKALTTIRATIAKAEGKQA